MALFQVQQFPGVLIGMCPPDLEAPRLLNPSNLVHLPTPSGDEDRTAGRVCQVLGRIGDRFTSGAGGGRLCSSTQRPAITGGLLERWLLHADPWWAEAGATITTSAT